MKLYRMRTIDDRPSRKRSFIGNWPVDRARGRWFTSSLEDAIMFGQKRLRRADWEIIMIDVPDDIAETYRVATTPRTPCGLTPINYADDPETEYLVPYWRTLDAVPLDAIGETRERDYIQVEQAPAKQVAKQAGKARYPTIVFAMPKMVHLPANDVDKAA